MMSTNCDFEPHTKTQQTQIHAGSSPQPPGMRPEIGRPPPLLQLPGAPTTFSGGGGGGGCDDDLTNILNSLLDHNDIVDLMADVATYMPPQQPTVMAMQPSLRQLSPEFQFPPTASSNNHRNQGCQVFSPFLESSSFDVNFNFSHKDLDYFC